MYKLGILLSASLLLAACTASTQPADPSASPDSSAGATSAFLAAPLTLADGSAVTSATELTSGQSVASQRMDVLLDGWSLKTLGATKVLWEDSTGKTGTVSFSPATSGQVSALLATEPSVLTSLGARLVSPSADLECTAQGCTGTHPFNPEWLTDPGQVPIFGASYEGYGIKNLLHVGSIDLSPEAESVTFFTEGSSGALMTTVLSKDDPGTVTQSGYGRNLAVLSAAFQNVFLLDPQWLEDGVNYVRNDPLTPADSVEAAESSAKILDLAPAFDGLSQPWAAASYLNAPTLTYFSSPTTGCGVAAICVPVPITPVVQEQTEDIALCSSTTSTFGVDGPVPARLVKAQIEVDYPQPTNQFAMWEVSSLNDLEQVPEAGGANGGGLPTKLLEGPTTLYWDTALLMEPNEGQLVDIVGTLLPQPSQSSLEENLASLSLDGTSWSRCS